MLNYFSRTKLRGLWFTFLIEMYGYKGEIIFQSSLTESPYCVGLP